MNNILILICFIFVGLFSPAEQALCQETGIDANESSLQGWANGCDLERGYIQIDDTTITHEGSNKAIFGQAADATGKADNRAVSLGDSGVAVLSFDNSFRDGEGWDFAVFENSFNGTFLELAFVEVSSDGEKYVRFPAVSNIPVDEQIPTFGETDGSLVHNLAGNCKVFQGTPFDLSELKDSAGLDIQSVKFVKVIDVIGNISKQYASYDSRGTIINDPWPTPFFTSGFDLDAVGVRYLNTNNNTNSFKDVEKNTHIHVYPNPFRDFIQFKIRKKKQVIITIYSTDGNLVTEKNFFQGSNPGEISFCTSNIKNGIYILTITGQSILHKQIIVKQ